MKTIWQQAFQYILGAVIVVGFFVLLSVLVQKEIPPENKATTNLVVGALIGSFTTVVGYFYGSSKGSQSKDEMLNKKNE